MTFQLPPIAKTAERLLLEIEQAVAGFPRKHRYTAGEELRKQAMGVTVLVHRAWRDRKQQLALIERVVWEVDALKIRMQLCSRLRASLHRRFPWIDSATRRRRFSLRLEGRQLTIPIRSPR